MKFAALAFITALIVGNAAQAEMKAPGTFVPSQCGVQSEEAASDVKTVCMGSVVGQQARFVQFTMADNTVQQFQVVSQANMLMAMMSGKVKAMYYLTNAEGARATMKVIQSKDGSLNAVSGNLGGTEYFVPKMQIVFTTL